MKRILSIILTLSLLLPGIALADVQSQVNAPETFQAAYSAPCNLQLSLLFALDD